jgi:translation initiation factor IF-1
VIPDRVQTLARITEVLSARTAHGELPNGKSVFLFVEKEGTAPPLNAGDHVSVQLSVADFSQARILPSH